MANAFSYLPMPTPLRRAALVEFQWGEQHFEIVCIACSMRLIEWPDTGEEMIWLHTIAMRTAEVNWGGSTNMMNVLIPAHYVTSIKPSITFRLNKSGTDRGVRIFPPIHPTPGNRLPLADLERAIGDLFTPELN